MAKQAGLAGNASFDELRYQLEDKDQEIARLKLNLKGTEDELIDTRRQLYDKKAECNASEERIMELSADVGKWKSAANRGGGGGGGVDPQTLLRKDSEIERLRKELVIAKRQLEDKEKELHAERQRERQPAVPKEHYRAQIQHVQTENTKLTDQVLTLTDELEQLRFDYQTLSSNRGGRSQMGGTSDDEFYRLKQDYKTLEDANMALHQQAVYYEEDFKREKQEREEANARYKNALDEIAKLKAELRELRGSPPPQSPRERPDDYTDNGAQHYAHTISHEGDMGRDRLVTTNRSFPAGRYQGGHDYTREERRQDYKSPPHHDASDYYRGGDRRGSQGDYYSQRESDRRSSNEGGYGVDDYNYTPQRNEGSRSRNTYHSSSSSSGGNYSDYHRDNY